MALKRARVRRRVATVWIDPMRSGACGPTPECLDTPVVEVIHTRR